MNMLTGCGKPATRPCFKLGVPALFVILFIVLVCHPALPQARILTPIDDTQLVSLQGNTNPLVQPANDQGPVEDNFPASRMILLLRRSPDREAALQDFLQAVQNPASPQFHRYLTPQQFGRQFGLDERDTDSVEEWLRDQGFSVARLLSGRTAIEFSGTAAQVQAAFHTQIHRYLVHGELHFANSSEPRIPSALAPVISGVTLNNFVPHALNRSLGEATLDPVNHHASPLFNFPTTNYPGCLDGYCFAVVPGDFAAIYNTKPLLASGIEGTGVTLGIIGVSNIDTAIVKRFRQNFLPSYSAANLPNVIVDGPDPGMEDQDDEIEAYLDVEEAGAMAPNATVNFYTAANSYVSNGLGLALARALDDNQVSILSVSFGECEAYLGSIGNQYYSGFFQQAAAQGITVLVSSGDSGSAACDPPVNTSGPEEAVSGLFVSGLASTPYNIAVGGTDFHYPPNATLSTLSAYWNMPTASNPNNNADWSSALGYIPEKPWDQGDPVLDQVNFSPSLAAGGGGKSSCISYTGHVDSGSTANKADCHGGYPKPAWQNGFVQDKSRDLPDISLFASDVSNFSFTAVCVFDDECEVPNAGPNSVTEPIKFFALGGTSVSAPVMAGVMALVVQKTNSRQGQANSVLYPLSQQVPQAFHDIAVGTNSVPCAAGTPDCGTDGYLTGYSATAGYDLATGLGSIDAKILVDNWSLISFKPTATTLAIAPTTAPHNTPLTFTIDVTGGPASGEITLFLTHPGGTARGQYITTCAAFPCVFTYAALPGGSYGVSARYAGDSTYAPSTSGLVPVDISKGSSELAIYYQIGETPSGQVTNLNGQTDLIYGRIITFTAVPVPQGYNLPADPDSITATPATGVIQVSDKGVPIGAPLQLDATGRATSESFSLAVGKHSLTAAYSGDVSYQPSTTLSPLSTPLSFTIGQASTTLYLTPYYQQVLPGSGASVTATLDSVGQAAPTGTVAFSVLAANGVTTVLPPVKLKYDPVAFASSATASIPSSVLVPGPPDVSQAANTIVIASYSGDINYLPTTQLTAAGIYDAQAYSNTFLIANPQNPVAGQSLTITARVGWSNILSIPGYPGGTVIFLDGTNELGSVSTVPDGSGNGVATFTTSKLSVGAHKLNANYSGDKQFLPSSASIEVTVSPAPPPVEDFTLTATPIAVASGALHPTEVSILTLKLNYATGTASNFTITCTSPPQPTAISCGATPAVTIAPGDTAITAVATVTIDALTSKAQTPGAPWMRAIGGLSLAILLPFGTRKRARFRREFLGLFLLVALAIGLNSCQSITYRRLPAGNYSVTVTAKLGDLTHQTTVPITVE